MLSDAQLRWLDCQEAAERLNASRSRYLTVGVNLLTWGILSVSVGCFWWYLFSLIW